MILACDTETTGLGVYHGARPFLVTTCTAEGEQRTWEWDVNPEDRTVTVLPQDVEEIVELVDAADSIVFHHAKFDIGMLKSIGVMVPWEKVHDTIVAGHLLGSKDLHSLDEMAKQYLRDTDNKPLDITTHEKHLDKIVNTARAWVRVNRPHWSLSAKENPDTPGVKSRPGKGDMWLPRAICVAVGEDDEIRPGWETACRTYADVDSAVTMQLWQVVSSLMEEAGLMNLYRSSMEVLPALMRMEDRGVTIHEPTTQRLKSQYAEESEQLGRVCVGVAESMGYELMLPNGPRNESIDTFVYGRQQVTEVWDDVKQKHVLVKNPKVRNPGPDTLNLTPHNRTESGAPSFDKEAKDWYELTLPKNTKPHLFVASLNAKAKRDTGLSYLKGYEEFWLPLKDTDDYKVIHPNFNATGTDTTRLSSNNPNAQNIGKQKGFSQRVAFGPAPGRVWYSLDAANIELRIPAYEAGEQALIDVFDNPNTEPYYGSYHLVIFDILHPELFAKYGKRVKDADLYESTLYQWVKNGNFARQYGAQEKLVDATYRVPGGYRKIGSRFPKIDALNRATIRQAERTGLVYTIPDKEIDPYKGYPLMCRRYPSERVSPTKPFCYHVSGTAGFWMKRALVKVDRQLEQWRRDEGFDGHMVGTVHDELLLDFDAVDMSGNLVRVQRVRELMESCGLPAIGVPTPVSAEVHTESWAKGVAIT